MKIGVVQVTPDGVPLHIPLNRMYLILAIDVASRAVLGYHLCYREEYSATDVLRCIYNGLKPWKKMSNPFDFEIYDTDAGFPSGSIEGCDWRAFDLLQIDNAKANICNNSIERVSTVVNATCNNGKAAHAIARAIVERFFETFNSIFGHRLPSTTGSDINDNRRHKAMEKAEKFEICIDEIEVLIDAVIANYNASPTTAKQGRSPLEYIRNFNQQYGLVFSRKIRREYQLDNPLNKFFDYRFVRSGKKSVRRPYIQFEGAIYQNDVLATTPSLSGTEFLLEFDNDDIRTAKAFFKNGEFFGVLNATGCWSLSKHSLKLRKLIQRSSDEKISSSQSVDPVSNYLEKLENNALKSRASRNLLLKIKRELGLESAIRLRGHKASATKKRKRSSWEPKRSKWISLQQTDY